MRINYGAARRVVEVRFFWARSEDPTNGYGLNSFTRPEGLRCGVTYVRFFTQYFDGRSILVWGGSHWYRSQW